MTKTDTAWVLSLGLVSSGTSESRRNGNICLADGAISKILEAPARSMHVKEMHRGFIVLLHIRNGRVRIRT